MSNSNVNVRAVRADDLSGKYLGQNLVFLDPIDGEIKQRVFLGVKLDKVDYITLVLEDEGYESDPIPHTWEVTVLPSTLTIVNFTDMKLM